MKTTNPNHWVWEWLYLASVFAVFVSCLYTNATKFDGTEIRTIVISGTYAIGAVGLLLWIRRKHRKLWRFMDDEE